MAVAEDLERGLARLGETAGAPWAGTIIDRLRENPSPAQMATEALDKAVDDLAAIASNPSLMQEMAGLLPNIAAAIKLRRIDELPTLDRLSEEPANFKYLLGRAFREASLLLQKKNLPKPGWQEILKLSNLEGLVTATLLMLYTEISYQRAWLQIDEIPIFFRALLETMAVNQSDDHPFEHLRSLFTEENGFSPALVEAVRNRIVPPEARLLVNFFE